MKRIAILGSTGSIGSSTLSVVEAHPERFSVVSLAAGGNVDAAFEQAKRWRPRMFSMQDAHAAERLRGKLRAAGLNDVEVREGTAGSVAVATHPEADFVVSAIVGVAGLEATFEAVRAGTGLFYRQLERWGECGLYEPPYVFFGDPQWIEHIRAEVQGDGRRPSR